MTEHLIQSAILLRLGSRPDVRLFRNNSAGAWGGEVICRTPTTITIANPYPIHAGLFKGSADLIGWRVRYFNAIPFAQFLSCEVKKPGGQVRPEQLLWEAAVKKAGGIAGIVRSVEEAEGLLI